MNPESAVGYEGYRAKILEVIATGWNASGINYAAMHGLEGYPGRIGRDLDVIVDKGSIVKAIGTAAKILQGNGFTVVAPWHPWHGRSLFAFRADVSLELHLLPALVWGPAVLVSRAAPSYQVGPFNVDPWATFAKRVLTRLLKDGSPRYPLLLPEEEAAIEPNLSRLTGRVIAKRMLSALKAQSSSQLRIMVGSIRRTVIARSLVLKPWSAVGLLLVRTLRILQRYSGRVAPIVAIVGTKGVDVTTAVKGVVPFIPGVFTGFEVRSFRPRVLPGMDLIPSGEPGLGAANRPRMLAVVALQYLRFAYYWLDFVVGHFCKDRQASCRGRVVIYDRCALDAAIDPARYGLDLVPVASLLYRYSPKPDLTVLIHDNGSRISSMSEGLSEKETHRRSVESQRFHAGRAIDLALSADMPPTEIGRLIRDEIVRVFTERPVRAP